MELKDIKVGDEVRLNQKLTGEEIEDLIYEYCLPHKAWKYLQEVRIVEAKHGRNRKNDWESVTLEGSDYYWPVELFEPVNTIKSKEEQSRTISRR